MTSKSSYQTRSMGSNILKLPCVCGEVYPEPASKTYTTALPRLCNWIWGASSRQREREGKIRKEEKGN